MITKSRNLFNIPSYMTMSPNPTTAQSREKSAPYRTYNAISSSWSPIQSPNTDPPETQQGPTRDPPETHQRPTRDPPETHQRPNTDPPETHQRPNTDPPETQHRPTRDPPETQHRPTRDPTQTHQRPTRDPTQTHQRPNRITKDPQGTHQDPAELASDPAGLPRHQRPASKPQNSELQYVKALFNFLLKYLLPKCLSSFYLKITVPFDQ
ncbi:hypothetical protein DPEC_G00029080 [Dallia pectoralis]|uniref:Uncharacterized protein n=1 Tax=Dallia pectoralis TaxID=75939 RepID=A0ACC2HIJ1_DALPE|nr:hypothetical protein DPEC_G00029080 [Dallia pectoralis]